MSSGGSDAILDNGLTCSVCLESYNEQERRPLLLPACGHTFCKNCLMDIAARDPDAGGLQCAACRKPQPVKDVQDLPVNYSLLEVARLDALNSSQEKLLQKDAQQMKKMDVCSEHASRLAFWCVTCEVAACGECLFEEHPRPDHHLVKIQDQLVRLQEMVKIRSSRVTTQLEIAAEENVHLLMVTFVNLVENLRQRRIIEGLLKQARVVRTCASDVNDLTSFNVVNKAIMVLQREFEKAQITTPTQVSVSVPLSKSTVSSSSNTATSTKLQDPSDEKTQEVISLQTTPSSGGSPIPHTPEVTDTPKPLVMPSRNAETRTASAILKPCVLPKPVSNTPQSPKVSHTAYNTTTHPSKMTARSPHTSNSGFWSLEMESPWWSSQLCGAFNNNWTTSRITLEPRGLHVYSLKQMKERCDVFLNLSVVLALAPLDAPVVFLDLEDNSRPLGRVYITLQIQLRRAQQFFSLCLGDRGPSYVGSYFHSVLRRGGSGEGLAGGDYESKAGKGGAAIVRGIDGTDEVAKRCERGMVVRASSRPETAAQFCISVKDGPRSKTVFPFGRVCQGLSVVEEACRRPAFSVSISDCGCVLPV
ncbi:uncharacterized protein [Cherax quadricarinatus]